MSIVQQTYTYAFKDLNFGYGFSAAMISTIVSGFVCAGVVAFIYRDDVYQDKSQPPSEAQGVAEIILGKQRNGPTGTVKLAFIREYTRFENLALGNS